MSMAKRRRKLSASVFIGVDRRVDADELKARLLYLLRNNIALG
jgi:hypothetical protein